MRNIFKDLKRKDHKRYLGGLDLFRYIGPGILVTVGFIDPINWVSTFAAGFEFGYSLLWVVTLSTIMLFVLQHTVFLQVGFTSSRKVMGDYVNSRWSTLVLYSIAA